MALEKYWCVFTRKRVTTWRGKILFDPVGPPGEMNLVMDLKAGYTMQAAFLHGLRQFAGADADLSEYRMNVYDTPGGEIRMPDFTAPADPAVNPDGPLRGVASEHLIAELTRRLRER